MKDQSLEANKVLSAKLRRLLSFLRWSGKEFEKVVERIANKNYKLAINAVILETSQYEREVDAHLQCLSPTSIEPADVIEENNPGKVLIDNCLNEEATTDREIMELFCKQEIHLEKEYRNILNECFPNQGLRQMLIYQMNGIKCAFMQLKLLRLVRTV